MINLIDMGLIFLIIVTFILIILIIFRDQQPMKQPEQSENFSEETQNQQIKNLTMIDDPIMMDHTNYTSDAVKFLSIPDGLKINMEDIVKMTPSKQNLYLEDSLFANVITYDNDDVDNQHMSFDRLGIGKCLKNPDCESCVEYGVTGQAMCFPKNVFQETQK